MKQNKKEELQSRRQFFKKAAKTALPILGAIALAQLPMIANASNASSGCDSCTGGCYYACQGTCKGACAGGCQGTCSNTCKYGCTSQCHAYSK